MKPTHIFFGIYLFLFSATLASGQADLCRDRTWSNCGIAVKQRLDANPTELFQILALAESWGNAFDKEYEVLRKKGRLERAVPDSVKIKERLWEQINPISLAKDAALDAIVKRYFARLAPFIKFATGPIRSVVDAAIIPSDIATDYDELRMMNDDIQRKIAGLLRPHLRPDWELLFQNAAASAAPQLGQGL
jgi:hypothetical protein